jgi:hypothetical protein
MDKEVVTLTGLLLTVLSAIGVLLRLVLKWHRDDFRALRARFDNHLIEHARPGIHCQACPHKKQKQNQPEGL